MVGFAPPSKSVTLVHFKGQVSDQIGTTSAEQDPDRHRLKTGNPHPIQERGVRSDRNYFRFIQASGRWDNHREHGIQFKTTFLKVM